MLNRAEAMYGEGLPWMIVRRLRWLARDIRLSIQISIHIESMCEIVRSHQPKTGSQLRLRPHPNRRQPIHDLLRLPLDPPQQHLARRHISNQAHHEPRRPHPILGVARLVHEAPALPRDEVADVLELRTARTALERDDLLRDGVLVHARRVAQRAEDVRRVRLGGRDDRLLDLLVDRAARAAVSTGRAEWRQ